MLGIGEVQQTYNDYNSRGGCFVNSENVVQFNLNVVSTASGESICDCGNTYAHNTEKILLNV